LTRNIGAKVSGAFWWKHSINYLQNKDVKTIGLYAYPNLVGFYGSLGFKSDEDFILLHAKALDAMSAQNLPKVGRQQIKSIEKFDNKWFGGDRRKLLESIILEDGNLSYYVSEGNQVVGYVAATVTNEALQKSKEANEKGQQGIKAIDNIRTNIEKVSLLLL